MRAVTSSLCISALMAGCLLAAASGCCVKRGFVVRADCSLEVNRVPWMTGHGPKYEECKTCSAKDGKDCGKDGPGAAGGVSGGPPPGEPLPGPPAHSRLHPVPIGPVFGPTTGEPLPTPREDATSPHEAADSPSLDGPSEPVLEEPRPPADEPPLPDHKPSNSGVSRSAARRTSWTFLGASGPSTAESKSKPRPRPPVIP